MPERNNVSGREWNGLIDAPPKEKFSIVNSDRFQKPFVLAGLSLGS